MRNLLLVLLLGSLAVAAILSFIALGISNPVPWLLCLSLLVIPFLIKRKDEAEYVEWKDEYSVGAELLDADHKKLLGLINNLQTAVHYQTGDEFEKEALDNVIDYTKYHFAREEQMMKEAGYKDFEAHKQEHQKMILKIDALVMEYNLQGHEVLKEITLFLKNWLVSHINGTDQAYSSLLKDKP